MPKHVSPESYWELFERTVSGIYGPLKHGDGFGESAIVAAEERLRLRNKLPGVLREFYLRAAARRNDYNVKEFCCALEPSQMFVHDEGSVLVFADNRPNEEVSWSHFEWGILLDDIDEDDPPVVARNERDWVPCPERLSEWLMAGLYFNATQGGLGWMGAGSIDSLPPIDWTLSFVTQGDVAFGRLGQAIYVRNASNEIFVGARKKHDRKALDRLFEGLTWMRKD